MFHPFCSQKSYQQRLRELRLILENSDFFKAHEVRFICFLFSYQIPSFSIVFLLMLKSKLFLTGGGQLLIICPWPDWQGWNLDDRFRKDCAHAVSSHPGPPQPVGGGQQRRWLPLGPRQFYWHFDQHATSEMKDIMDIFKIDVFWTRFWDTSVTEGRWESTDGLNRMNIYKPVNWCCIPHK